MSKAHEEAPVSTIPGLGTLHDGEAAVREVEAEARALPAEFVAHANFDVTAAAMQTGGVKPRLLLFREEIRRRAPDVDIKYIDRIATYALAAWHAANSLRTNPKTAEISKKLARAKELNDDMDAAEPVLVRRRKLPADQIAKLQPKQGEQGTRWMLETLEKRLTVWRAGWNDVKGLSPITAADLDEAAGLTASLLLEMQSPEAMIEAETEMRHRIISLFVYAYEECRRAIRHIRWHQGDFDEICPTLRVQSSIRKPAQDDEDGAPAPKAAPPVNKSPDAKASPAVSDGKVVADETPPFTK